MTDKDGKTFVRDVTLGVLVIVLSFFIVWIAWMMTGYMSLLPFVGVIFLIITARLIFAIGYYMIKGLHVDLS